MSTEKNPTIKQMRLAKILAHREIEQVEMSDREALALAGYNSPSATTLIIQGDGVQKLLQKYLSAQEDTEKVLQAKLYRNLDEGLDSEDEDKKLAYTSLQQKRESMFAQKEKKVDVNVENINMMTILGLSTNTEK